MFRSHRTHRPGQRGGITIVVALMMLVLLMVAALAMSKDSMREVFLTGGMRQAADVMSQADGGLDWSLYWLGQNPGRPVPSGTQTGATAFITAWTNQQQNRIQGQWADILASTSTGYADLKYADTTVSKATDIQVMYMGKIARDPSSQNLPQQVTAQLRPDVFAVRATASASYNNGPTFRHRREVWTTVPIQN